MRTLILIDGDHFSYILRSLNLKFNFSRFYKSLVQQFGQNTKIRYYATITHRSKVQTRFIKKLNNIGYSVVTCPARKLTGEKEYVHTRLDSFITADGISLSENENRVVLVSGDSDFVPLIRELKNKGKVTVVVGLPLVTSRELRIVSDEFLTIEELFLKTVLKSRPSQSEISELLPRRILKSYYLAKGHYYDNYIIIRNLIKSAHHQVTIIDSYVNDEVLSTVSILNSNIKLRIITNHIQGSDFSVLLKKLKRDGRDIDIYRCSMFHDRFLKVDNEWWHLGHSLKDLGTGISLLNPVSNLDIINNLQRDEYTVYQQIKPILC